MLLRQKHISTQPRGATERQHVIIIGAGIGGIATANLLARAGYRVSVYEKNSLAGGRAGLLEKDGFRFDTGPSWYLMPEVFDHYFKLLDKDVHQCLQLTRLSPAYKVFFENEPAITVASDLAADAATFDAIEPGAGAALQRYVTQGDEIYRLAIRHFLYSNFSSLKDLADRTIVRNAAKMAALAVTPIDRYVSRFVTDRRLQQILEYPMVFLGASPFAAPALYSLMSALDFKEGVFYPKGGMYTIIEQLMRISNELGVTYHFNTGITRINTRGNQATGITLDNGSVVAGDIVISNADLHFTETQLLEPQAQTYPEAYWRKRQPGPSALLCYIGVRGALPELEHHNLLFVDSWRANFDAIYRTKTIPQSASLYLCKPSASDDSVAPAGHENVFMLVPLPPGITLDQESMEKLANQYIDQVAAYTGVQDFKQRIVSKTLFGPNDFAATFNAWQSTALGPSHVLSQSAFLRTPNISKKLSNLYYVGGFTTPGIGLPMCLISAELVYKRLIGDTKAGRLAAVKQGTGSHV